jgi:hypothetical protein
LPPFFFFCRLGVVENGLAAVPLRRLMLLLLLLPLVVVRVRRDVVVDGVRERERKERRRGVRRLEMGVWADIVMAVLRCYQLCPFDVSVRCWRADVAIVDVTVDVI